MARFARAVAVGCAHHITQRGVDQKRVFHTDTDRRTYLALLATASENARLHVLAYCLMDNHVHLVAIPKEPTSMAVALKYAHGRYAAYFNARRGRSGHLWQNRYYSCALDEAHLRVALRYVERNPVRAQLVKQAQDYRWSSAAAHLELCEMPALLDTAFPEHVGGAEGWRMLLAEPEELTIVRTLQRGTFSGRPVGKESFVRTLEQTLNRKLSPRQGVRNDLCQRRMEAS